MFSCSSLPLLAQYKFKSTCVPFYFLHFHWIGRFAGMFGIVGIFTQYVAVPFLNEDLKLHDTTIGMLGVIGCIIQNVCSMI